MSGRDTLPITHWGWGGHLLPKPVSLFVVIRAAKHPAGGWIHVMHLAAGYTFHRCIGRVIVGRVIGGPALDAEVLVRTAENECRHFYKMAGSADWFFDQSQNCTATKKEPRHLIE
jgi:hypothetical protein